MVDPVYSYASVISRSGLSFSTLGKVFESTAIKVANRKAIISMEEKVELTYKELNLLVEKMALFFVDHLKISVGDVIAIMSGNTYKFKVVQFACAKIGAIFVPINAYFKSDDLDYVLNTVKPKVFLIPGPNSPQEQSINKFYDTFWEIRNSLPTDLQSLIFLDSEPPLTHLNSIKVYLFDRILLLPTEKELSLHTLVGDFDADSICCVFFTSVSF